MPVIKNKKGESGVLESESQSGPLKGTKTRIRYYAPDGGETFDRIYMDPGKVQQWRERYLEKGFKSRKLSNI